MTRDPRTDSDPQPDSSPNETDDEPISAAEVVARLDLLWSDGRSDSSDARLGKYLVKRFVGRGSFGVVYEAYDDEFERQVAIKIPRPDVLLDEDRLKRFESEALVVAELHHPGIVPIYEAELGKATPYIASEFCPGPNLAEWMEATPTSLIDPRDAATFTALLAAAVHYAHEQGVIHRDLKPSNVLLAPKESSVDDSGRLVNFEPRLTDFGLASIAEGSLDLSSSSLVLGTPLYMSPEQAEGHASAVGPKSDVFALGAILYHLLTGAPPYAAETYSAVLTRLREEEVISPRRLQPGLDSQLETICLKCTERLPEDRYASAAQVAEDLERYARGEPIQARKPTRWRRFQRWLHQPSRVREATTAIILMSCTRIASSFALLALLIFLNEVPPSQEETIETLIAHFFVTLPNDLLIIWAARRNLQGRLPGSLYWCMLGWLLLWSAVCLGIACGVIPSTTWYQRMPGARTLVFGFVGFLFLAQAAAWIAAKRAKP